MHPMSKTPVPRSIFISQSPCGTRFSIGCHLRVGPTVGRQFNTHQTHWAELESWLREWRADPEEFYARHFDWRPADIDRQVSGKGLPPSNPTNGLSLSELGL